MRKSQPYSIVNDPLFYGVVAFFALLATLLPAALGQQRVLPIGQTIALFLLTFVAWRRGTALNAARVLALWSVVQGLTLFGVAYVTGSDQAVPNGFAYGQSLLEWTFGVGALPNSLTGAPLPRTLELAGVTIGATITGGITGIWSLVNSVNLYAFGLATGLRATGSVWGLVAAAEPWWLLRLAAYVGVVATFALPGYTGRWLPGQWLESERRLFFGSLAALAVALLLEFVLPGVWAGFASARIPSP